MTDRKSLDAAKQLVRRVGGKQAPSAEPFVPEIRSNMKWKATQMQVAPFRPDAAILVEWNFGVSFDQIEGFHGWLATNEVDLANLCAQETGSAAAYLGTFLHTDSGSPRYQTQWGLKDESAEGKLAEALARSPRLMGLAKVLRGYWARDPGATDHRYSLARNYINIDTLPSGGPFWDVTRESRREKPI